MRGEIPREVKLSRQGTCQSLIDLFIILIFPVIYTLNFAHKKVSELLCLELIFIKCENTCCRCLLFAVLFAVCCFQNVFIFY